MSFGERRTRRATFAWFEAEFSSIHRSTSTSTTASSEDALASILRSQVACVREDDDYVHAKRNDKDVPRNSRSRKDTEGVAQFC